VLPSGNKFKSEPIVNATADRLNYKVAMPVPNTAQTNGGPEVTKSAAASAAISEAVYSHSDGIASLHAKDCDEL